MSVLQCAPMRFNENQADHVGEEGGGTRLSSPTPSVPLWERPVLTVSEVAALCGKSDQTVYNWIKAGLPTVPHMAEKNISRAVLDAWLSEVAA